MMDEEGGLSLFIALYSFTNRQVSIIQLKQQEEEDEQQKNWDDFEVVRFNPPDDETRLIRWYVPPTTSSTDDLYIFPICHMHPPLHGYKFNFITASFRMIKPPLGYKEDAFVVNLGRRHTYFISALNRGGHTNTDFECYDADQDNWEPLKPFPVCPLRSRILATAAWGDTILFNVDMGSFWAYNVVINQWYDVDVDDSRCCSILGKAVVLQDTIYALEEYVDTVLALSIKIEGGYGDPVYKLSLHSEFPVLTMDPVLDCGERVWMPTRNLFHLGKHSFCLVKACMIKGFGFEVYLYIQLTYMELTGGKLAVVIERYHKLNIPDREHFGLVQCFFLPECKATALGRGKRLDFQLDPHEYQLVYVRKLPFNATAEQVEKRLQVFGPIVRDGIQVERKKKKCFAFVEFESAASKQDAIKAKTVYFGDCWAEIYDKKSKKERKMEMKMNQPHSSDEGHSVYVSNLPRHATVEQVEKELNVFGPIARDGIQVNIKKKEKVFAFVEFESAASKQRAIEAKTVYFGDRLANIYDRKRKMKKNQPHSRDVS